MRFIIECIKDSLCLSDYKLMKATERRSKRRITLSVLISLSLLLGIISFKPRVKKVVFM